MFGGETASPFRSPTLTERCYLDYSRIQHDAVKALDDPDDPIRLHAQKLLADRIRYVIVDEYQAVNPLHEALIRRLYGLGTNICEVVDEARLRELWKTARVVSRTTIRRESRRYHRPTGARRSRRRRS
ncbi:UvrD-helicase domain-containing protein [Persicimonas caeni]|uniref:UvrD-helicase domain-containing protein n=1 Tax=Persicimonas caeni TaxID=2292766 RepID=UPI00143CC0F1|nr:UvrD-helicase domain-containing protein [Persicimonas caeni]